MPILLRPTSRRPGPAAAVFQCAAETFILLFYRRPGLTAARETGQIRVAGNFGTGSRGCRQLLSLAISLRLRHTRSS